MSEKVQTSLLLDRLRKRSPKSWFYKVPDPSRCAKCGTIGRASKRPFDVVGVLNFVPVAIEFKMNSCRDLSEHQTAHLELFHRAGGIALVVEIKNKKVFELGHGAVMRESVIYSWQVLFG